MILRPELLPPAVDEAKVLRLADLADRIDGAGPGQWENELAEFNRDAGTDLTFIDFQGISGSQSHTTWVRTVLARPYLCRLADVSRDELVKLARSVMTCDGKEHEIAFWLAMLALNLPDSRVSDLIYWPGEYFGDGDNARELTPEQVVDISRARTA